MNKKQRVLAALKGLPVDRPPVSFWRHFDGEDAKGRRCVERHVEFYRATELDFLKVMHDGLSAPCSLDIHSADDLRAIRPKGRKNPYIQEFLERAAGIVDILGGEIPIYANVFAPFTLLRRFGDERLRYHIRTNEQAVLSALDAISEDLALLCELLVKEAGCLGVFAAFQGAESTRFTLEEFDRIVRPSDMKMLHAANAASQWNILHLCAWDEITNQMERWRNYHGRAVNWSIYVDHLELAEGKAYFGDRCVMGGFDNRRGGPLFSGTKEEVTKETYAILDRYYHGTGSLNGLILGADCSMLSDFYLERLNWVSQALQEYSPE